MRTIVRVKNLSKSYGQRKVLDNLSFSVEEQTLLALIGPSGSGKSTILNILGLLEQKSQGQIELFGQASPPINSHRAMLLRRGKINYLFQSGALVHHLSVEDNILLAMNYIKQSKRSKKARIQAVLRSLGLAKLASAKVNTLSGGEQQRVALARCILKPGELVLADEPTGSLDQELAERIFQEIKALTREYKKTVIMVTHSLHLARQCDQIISLERKNLT